MPLPECTQRREIHHRLIDMHAYAREDGLYDIEGQLRDSKPYDFIRPSAPTQPVPADAALHDLWIRMTVDSDYVVREIVAAAVSTPWELCKQAEATLKVLEGERIGRGWSSMVKDRLRGAASCTHLMEMLIPMATTAIQAIRPINRLVVDIAEQTDTCYAFGRDREVVQRLWPLIHGR